MLYVCAMRRPHINHKNHNSHKYNKYKKNNTNKKKKNNNKNNKNKNKVETRTRTACTRLTGSGLVHQVSRPFSVPRQPWQQGEGSWEERGRREGREGKEGREEGLLRFLTRS